MAFNHVLTGRVCVMLVGSRTEIDSWLLHKFCYCSYNSIAKPPNLHFISYVNQYEIHIFLSIELVECKGIQLMTFVQIFIWF